MYHICQYDATPQYTLELPKKYSEAQVLLDFLYLLPGDSKYRQEIIGILEDIPKNRSKRGFVQRQLSSYQSYYRFDILLTGFWATATVAEKNCYFPIYFWWRVTGIIPLRPIECVLTPRNCIRRDENGEYHLTLRRSIRKGTIQSSRYSLEKDFRLHEYRISAGLAEEILAYIDRTQHCYKSDNNTLFCKQTQFSSLGIPIESDSHYSGVNLSQCLSHYYKHILCSKMGQTIVETEGLLNGDEIERIYLGDARHLAIISLMSSGASLATIRELVGHHDSDISAHYATNISTMTKALGYERCRVDKDMDTLDLPTDFSMPVDDGFCISPLVKVGDFSDCGKAVSAMGTFCDCHVCNYYRGNSRQYKKLAEDVAQELKDTCMLLTKEIELLQKATGSEDTVMVLLDRVKALAEQQVNLSATERLLRESEEI